MAYITAADIREYLEQVPSSKDAVLGKIATRATSIIDQALGFSFFATGASWSSVAASARRVQSERSTYLRLPPYQYSSITSLVLISGTTVDTTQITDYEETHDQFYLYRAAGWGALRYVVTAKYGYGPAPDSIVELCMELAINIWRAKDKGLFTELIGVEGGGQIRYVGGLTKQQQAIIDATRRQYLECIQ